jgi:hypothetical protein
VQKWETGAATPRRRQLEKLVRLAESTASAPPIAPNDPDLFTIAVAARHSGISEKTLRQAVKQGRLPHTVDTSPGPWPRCGRFLLRRADLHAFKLNDYDPYFRKGRWLRVSNPPAVVEPDVVVASNGSDASEKVEQSVTHPV